MFHIQLFYFIIEVINSIELLRVHGEAGLGWREVNGEIVHNIHSVLVQGFNNFENFIIVVIFIIVIFSASSDPFLFFAPSKITAND